MSEATSSTTPAEEKPAPAAVPAGDPAPPADEAKPSDETKSEATAEPSSELAAERKAETREEPEPEGNESPEEEARPSLPEIEPGPGEPPPVPPPRKKASEHPAPMSVTPTAAAAWPPNVVGDIMTRKVIAIQEHEPIGDLEKTMDRFHFHHLPVVTPDMQLVGLITRSDYLRAMLGHPVEGNEPAKIDAKTPASAIMRRNVVTGTPDAPLATACRVMVENEISCFPIILEDQTLVGIVTQADFVKLVLEFLEL